MIDAWGLNFNLGNAVKYISRADLKGSRIEDLRKAMFYLELEIERITAPDAQVQNTEGPAGCESNVSTTGPKV